MSSYEITTVVEYTFEVEADDLESATQKGYEYEDYQQFATIVSVEVAELEEDEDE